MNERRARELFIGHLVKKRAFDKSRIFDEVPLSGRRVHLLSGAPGGIRLDVVAVNEDGKIFIFELKHNCTAVLFGWATGQLLVYASLLEDKEVFDLFKKAVQRKASRRNVEINLDSATYDDLIFIAELIETENYPFGDELADITKKIIGRIDFPKFCLQRMEEKELLVAG